MVVAARYSVLTIDAVIVAPCYHSDGCNWQPPYHHGVLTE